MWLELGLPPLPASGPSWHSWIRCWAQGRNVASNNSFKPTHLRYTNGGTEKRATVCSATVCGLTQVLGLTRKFRRSMKSEQVLTPRRAILTFVLAVAGALTGILAGPRLAAAFQNAPQWLLPAILVASVLLALVGAYVAFRLGEKA